MKAPTPSPLHPVSSPARTFDELDAIRVRLEDAQRAESDAIRKLGELARQAASDKATFDRLFAEVRETRRRAVEVYEEWNRTVAKIREDQAERTRKRR